MPTPSSPDLPSPPVEGTIARSRSRYKGPRQHKSLSSPSEPPSLNGEQLQPRRNVALSPREPRPQNDGEDRRGFKRQPSLYESTQRHPLSANNAPRSEAFMGQKRGNLRKADNRTTSQDEVNSQSQAPLEHQQNRPRRRYDAEAEPHKEVDQYTASSREEVKSPEQCSRNPGPDLHCPHKEAAAVTVRSHALPRRGFTQRNTGHSNGKRLHKSREELKRTISAPIAIEPPQTTAKPAFDAPVSAVNAGERRVKVKYGDNLMFLPVTPSTTPLDIIRFAADQLVEFLDPNRTVLIESFKQLGLERPLRKYEHVRDVLNSWDSDTQNTLVIKPSPTGSGNDLVDLHCVSKTQPVGTSVYIQYSQRPGHWDKRWVTLRSDGQMLVAKREGGETASICHISDFDIYTPTARQSAKSIRPPRKICFAVKSQQKSSIFLSTANFVHFFSTSDKSLATSWYKAVQEWRSWYLVNVMGEGREGAQSSQKASTKADIQQFSSTEFSKLESQRRPPEPPSQGTSPIKGSTLAKYNAEHFVAARNSDSRHKVAGDSFDLMRFRSRSESQTPQSTKPTEATDIGASREQNPSFAQAVRQIEPEPFAATGLLGVTYTQRQKAQREREHNPGPDQPVAPPNNDPVIGLNRTLSQRPKPKPLIDLTPRYQEPPQHAKKGRGVVLERIPAGGLVEVANTPETAISIPPSTTWRRPTSRGREGPSIGRSKTIRRDHSSGLPSEPKQSSRSPEKGDVALAGGLVADDSRGQGGARTRRGVMTGDRQAKEPMLDAGEERWYAPGSLLERVERRDGGSHPIDESKKKREIIAAVGGGT